MAPPNSVDALASALVARFLRANNYTETLQAFVREADLPLDVGHASGDDTHNWSIQNLIEEKRVYDHTVNFERYGGDDKGSDLWTLPGKTRAFVEKFSLLGPSTTEKID